MGEDEAGIPDALSGDVDKGVEFIELFPELAEFLAELTIPDWIVIIGFTGMVVALLVILFTFQGF